jgi:P4 family phage/plasmid primase-like protien
MSAEAISFLKWLRADGPWLLTAIIPDGKTETETFAQVDDLAEFIARHDGKRNLYYSPNPVAKAMSKKTKKDDIAAAEVIHADLDPKGTETPEQAKERILKAIGTSGLPKPSAAIDSGNGIQLLWRLAGPLRPAIAVEAHNKAVLQTLGDTDGTWNVDRILRLPGTTNLPTKKKREKGRVASASRLLWANGETYSPKDFPAAEQQQQARAEGELPSVDIDKLPISDELKGLIKEGDRDNKFKSRSEAAFYACCSLIRCGIADEVILAIMLDESLRISDHALAQADPRRSARRALEAALKEQPRPFIVSATDHLARARALRDAQRPHLLHHRDDFVDWERGAYRIIAEGTINAEVWDFLDHAITVRGKGQQAMPFQPNRSSVGETLAALKAVAHLAPEIDPPHWLDGRAEGELIAFPNGLLDIRSGKLLPPDPAFFTFAALGFDYESKGAEPIAWMTFLDEIFRGESDQIEALQEAFGYLITGDVSQEKAIMLLGPKRSGKGTILRALRCLLSPEAVKEPSLKFLGTNFALAALIGKQIAIIDDLRLGPRSEQDVLIENILKITGRGRFTIDRKYKEAWTGLLPIKLVLVSNEMPKLGDESAAVASRFIIFNTRVSFYGREDPRLFEDKLEPERVGILHWSLDGLRRMRERGRLIEPEASKDLQEEMAKLGSDAKAFIAEHCVLEPEAHVSKDELFNAYRSWCKSNDIRPWAKEKFCQAIYAATDHRVSSGRPRVEGVQVKSCLGIRLLRPDEEVM